MGEVINVFGGPQPPDEPADALHPDDVLEGAKGKLRDVALIGADVNGEIYIASSEGVQSAHWAFAIGQRWLEGLSFRDQDED